MSRTDDCVRRQRVGDAVFPRKPGAYVVYEPNPPDKRPLYVGVAATQTLCERWCAQHLKNRAGGSALRRTLGVELGLVQTKLTHKTGRYYPPEVERAITDFLTACDIELYPAETPGEADALEVELRNELCPRLNISQARRRRPVPREIQDPDGASATPALASRMRVLPRERRSLKMLP